MIDSLSRKLKILDDERCFIQEEISSNEALGESLVQAYVAGGAPKQQVSKLLIHLSETEKIATLLLKVRGQLDRVDAAIAAIDANATTAGSDANVKEKVCACNCVICICELRRTCRFTI